MNTEITVSRYDLESILIELEHMDCTFIFCDGPDAPFQSMATCRRCGIMQTLRSMLGIGNTWLTDVIVDRETP